MRYSFRLSSCLSRLLAVGLLASPAVAASAQERRASGLSAVLFSGLEIEPYSAFLSSGGKLGLAVGDQVRVFVLGSSGLSLSDMRLMRDGKLARREVAAEARLFLGMERNFGPVFASAGIGASVAQYVDSHGTAIRRAGIAGQFDGWYRPAPDRFAQASALFDTSQRAVWLRLRYGFRPASIPVYFGPEASYGVSRGSQKVKLGLHASEFRVGFTTFAIAAGAMWEHGRPGGYLSVTSYSSF